MTFIKKNLFNKLLLIFLMYISFTAQGQLVLESQMEHEDQMRPSLALQANMPKDKAFEFFEEFFKDRYKINLKGDGFLSGTDELYFEEQKLPFSDNAMDMYVSFKSISDEETNIQLTARNGYDLYFSENYQPNIYSEFKALLLNYSDHARQAYINMKLEAYQSQIKGLEKDQQKDLNDIEKNKTQIEENLEENIELNKENEKMLKVVKSRSDKLNRLKNELRLFKMKQGDL